METNQTMNHRLDKTVYELIYDQHPVRGLYCKEQTRVEPQHIHWDGDRPYLLNVAGQNLDLTPLIAQDPPKFIVEPTRLIGITTAEHEALKRGATLILGQPSEGMQPIEKGQELLAIVGYVPGEAPRMDTARLRLRVTGETFEATPTDMFTDEISALTGHPYRKTRALADIDLTMFLQAVCDEIKSFDPATSKIAIPVEAMN